MNTEQQHRIEQIRERQRRKPQRDLDIDFLLSLVESQEAEYRTVEQLDGSVASFAANGNWCVDCHSYTHKSDCRSAQTKMPLVDRVVDAVYRSMARYESGEWWLDTLKAKARVKRLLTESDAATSMRSACIEKVKAMRDQWKQADEGSRGGIYTMRWDTAGEIITALESVAIQDLGQ